MLGPIVMRSLENNGMDVMGLEIKWNIIVRLVHLFTELPEIFFIKWLSLERQQKSKNRRLCTADLSLLYYSSA